MYCRTLRMCATAYTTNTVSNMKSMYCGVWRRRGGTKSVYMYVTTAYLCVCDVGMTLLFFSLITTWWVQNMFYRSRLFLPFFLFFLSSIWEYRFLSSSLSLSFSSFQHLVPLWNKKKYYYYSSFITSFIPFFPNSRDATIIVCPIYFFAIFIFLEERSHLVFRLLYNWKMMRWQMHIYIRGHPKIDRERRRRRRRRRIYRWCCHLQKKKR
jgi:hypothetical protein